VRESSCKNPAAMENVTTFGSIQNSTNKITYYIEPNYNEMQLLNDLKVPLNNSCEYYTVSWNIYSYLQDD